MEQRARRRCRSCSYDELTHGSRASWGQVVGPVLGSQHLTATSQDHTKHELPPFCLPWWAQAPRLRQCPVGGALDMNLCGRRQPPGCVGCCGGEARDVMGARAKGMCIGAKPPTGVQYSRALCKGRRGHLEGQLFAGRHLDLGQLRS